MPELPDVETYVRCLARRIVGHPCRAIRIASPFLLRSVAPPPSAIVGQTVTGVRRLGKRIVVGLTDDLFVVMHLMIAGRLRWRDTAVAIPKKRGLAAVDFPQGTILFTEEGSKKRASLHIVEGETNLGEHDQGGIEPLATDLATFQSVLQRENHTLKRALTDPRSFSGIGNAYSDEILHAARLSPLALTERLSDAAVRELYDATVQTLNRWVERLVKEIGDGFPEKVTAFRPEMAVHGRYQKPCPICGSPVQRIVYASNEANYCATCQTKGKLLADRALSRLLKTDWPKSLDALGETT